MRKWLFVPVLLLTGLTPVEAAQRAFEIADYYRTALVGSPALNNDGGRAVFAVQRYDLGQGQSWSEIWMINSDGSGLRQMTTGRHSDTSPQFSPDGTRILFVSSRDGSSQIYSMPVDGGEPERLTEFSLDLSDPVWSPDGKWIAVTADVFPECGADSACNARVEKGLSEGKLKVHVADELLYRHWTSWRDGRYTHILLVEAASGKVVRDLTPGRWDSPTFSLSGDRGYAFSPDGKELCFVSNHDSDAASSTNADLWTLDLADDAGSAEAVNLTATNLGWAGAPVYSPDGRYIAFRSQAEAGYESDLFRIALHDRETRSVRYLTDRGSFDNWIDEIQWLPDGSGLCFQAEVRGRNPLFRISLDTGRIERLLTDGTIGGWGLLGREADAVLYSRRKVGSPPELYRASLAGAGEPRRLTSFNAKLEREVDIRPAEELWVKGEGDYEIQVFVIKPHDFDPAKKYPLILNVHGGPQSQWMDSYRGDWQVYPGKGYVVAFSNPTGSSGFGQDFVDAIGHDWGGRVFRDLMKTTDTLEELPYVDEDRMGAMGWSYGGYMMMWFEGHTRRVKAIAAMMGLYDLRSFYGATEELWFPERDLGGAPWNSDLYGKWSPAEFVEDFATPSLVVTGERDYRVSYTQSLQFFTALQKQGVPSRLVVFPDAGHWPGWYEMAFYYNVHLDWFHQWLGGEEAPYDVTDFSRNLVFEPSSE